MFTNTNRKLVLVLVALGITTVLGPLYAQGLPDPATQPAESISLVEELWRKGQISQALIIVAFVVLTFASKRVPWLRGDHRAVYVSAGLAAIGMLAEAASRGTTPNTSMVLTAILAAITLTLNPRAPAQVAAGTPTALALAAPAVVVPPEMAIVVKPAETKSEGGEV